MAHDVFLSMGVTIPESQRQGEVERKMELKKRWWGERKEQGQREWAREWVPVPELGSEREREWSSDGCQRWPLDQEPEWLSDEGWDWVSDERRELELDEGR